MHECLKTEEDGILEDIRDRLTSYGKDRRNLIPILQMIQTRHKYLPGKGMALAADHLDISIGEVYGVATFYNQFRFHPPGKHTIKVCLGTACHVKGGDIILENFERKLEIKEGQTTADREFSLERVACVGCCALAPVAVADEAIESHMAPSKVEGLVLRYQMKSQRQSGGK